MRAADALLLDGLTRLPPITADPAGGEEEIALAAADVARLRAVADALAELAERLQGLAGALPPEDLEATREQVAEAAAEDLAHGIIDPARARLAARMLSVGPGWRALARALRSSDVHVAWGGMSAGTLLGCFRDADERLVARVLAVAQLPPGTPLSGCDADAAKRLAAALEEHAPRSTA